MEFNLSAGSAAVVLTSMGIIWGIIMKVFPKKEKSEVVAGFMKSIKEIMETQNITLALMKQTTDGSHDKLNIITGCSLRINNIEEKVDRIVANTTKD